MALTMYSSFRMVAESYIDDLEERTHNTLFSRDLTSRLGRYAYPFIEGEQISKVSKEQLIAIRDYIKSSGGSAYKLYLFFDDMKRIFRYAQGKQILIDNPCQDIKIAYPWNLHCRHFSETEIAALHRGFHECSLKELFMFSLISGLPVRESAALKASDVDLTSGMCHITEEVQFKPARSYCSALVSAKSPRTITLVDECINYLKTLVLHETGVFFPGTKKELVTQMEVQVCLMQIQYYSGIADFAVHQLVENYIYECLNIGMDMVSLEEYLRYSRGYILKAFGCADPGREEPILLGNSSWRIL